MGCPDTKAPAAMICLDHDEGGCRLAASPPGHTVFLGSHAQPNKGHMAGDRDAPHALEDSVLLTAAQARALVRLVEEAPNVLRRHHFFNWLQTHVHAMVPHAAAACGAYNRQRRGVVYDVFHNVVLPAEVMALLQADDSPFVEALVRVWQEGRCRAFGLRLGPRAEALLQLDVAPLLVAGLEHVAVHGVARPQRPSEIESMFVFGGSGESDVDRMAARLELLLPHLHATWLRVQGMERELGPAHRAPAVATPEGTRLPITAREREILEGVREGKSNVQIGEALGISGLTVKNHVQKILRKLGAHTRAQAVALTMGHVPLHGNDALSDGVDEPLGRRPGTG